MKKLCLVALVAIFSFGTLNAQGVNFGASAGYVSGNVKISEGGNSFTGSDSGFYFGLLAEIEVSEEFIVQPEIVYTNIESTGFLQIPIMAKYYVSDKFNILAGPQFTYTLEDVIDDFTKLNIGLGIGLGYDFSEEFFAQAKYAFQVNDYFTGSGDFSSTIGFLNVGIGYRF